MCRQSLRITTTAAVELEASPELEIARTRHVALPFNP
jgi:hypothetical protein